MCNNGAKDNLGQDADFIWLGSGVTVRKCPHPGTAEMNDRAASGSYFNIREVRMPPVPGIASPLCSKLLEIGSWRGKAPSSAPYVGSRSECDQAE
jgi:hypothetical protein